MGPHCASRTTEEKETPCGERVKLLVTDDHTVDPRSVAGSCQLAVHGGDDDDGGRIGRQCDGYPAAHIAFQKPAGYGIVQVCRLGPRGELETALLRVRIVTEKGWISLSAKEIRGEAIELEYARVAGGSNDGGEDPGIAGTIQTEISLRSFSSGIHGRETRATSRLSW